MKPAPGNAEKFLLLLNEAPAEQIPASDFASNTLPVLATLPFDPQGAATFSVGRPDPKPNRKMMVDFRANPPKAILGSEVVKINDFQTLRKQRRRVKTGAKTAIEQDRSNVLQWFTADGTAVSVRPSEHGA